MHILLRRARESGIGLTTNKTIILIQFHEYVLLRTVVEAHLSVVARTFGLAVRLIALKLDIVPTLLSPKDHLLRAANAVLLVAFAPLWRMGFGKRDGTRRTDDFALEGDERLPYRAFAADLVWMNIHIRFSAMIGDPSTEE